MDSPNPFENSTTPESYSKGPGQVPVVSCSFIFFLVLNLGSKINPTWLTLQKNPLINKFRIHGKVTTSVGVHFRESGKLCQEFASMITPIPMNTRVWYRPVDIIVTRRSEKAWISMDIWAHLPQLTWTASTRCSIPYSRPFIKRTEGFTSLKTLKLAHILWRSVSCC